MNIAFAALFGLAFGSFVNAAIDRIPRGVALSGRSQCDACGKQLSARHLIPVFSYMLLRGRCDACTSPIGIRTPLIEVGCAVGFVATFGILSAPLAIAACAAIIATTIGAGVAVQTRRMHQ